MANRPVYAKSPSRSPHEPAAAGANGTRGRTRALERAGYFVSRTSGSHCRLIHASDPTRKVTVPIHGGDLKRGTLRSIVAQAGLRVAEFVALL